MTPEGRLVARWLTPISLVLYPVIFAPRPQDEADRVAEELNAASQPGRRSSFRDFTTEELNALIVEIRLELESPTQSVRDILDLCQDEADLREYLRLVVDRLASLMQRRQS